MKSINDFPRSDVEKQDILKDIMKKFEEGKIYSEVEVNEVLKEFYDDFVLIRRELINFGYMERDPRKGEYRVLKKELSDEEIDKIKKRENKIKDMGLKNT
ncbi:DUF2087 domain-containing protein [Candidatus Woesearchaeota archaeon]|nr:DUF2087 domain-containing protein [Candidatus Woesearchaeota archaeon]